MSKGLKALKELPATTREEAEAIDIIEQELKDKEKYEDFVQEICNYLGLDNLFPYNDLKEIEEQIKTMADNSHWIAVMQDQRKIKALEIVKEKGVFVHLLQQSQNVEEYNSLILIAFKKMAERDYKGAVEKFCLTKEEYDLLKEVGL